MDFHWSLSYSNFRLVVKILQIIPCLGLDSLYPLISICYSLLSRLLGSVPRANYTKAITITFILHNISALWLDPRVALFFRVLLFSLCGVLQWQKTNSWLVFSNLLINSNCGLLAGKVSNPRKFHVSHFCGLILVYHFQHGHSLSSCTISKGSTVPSICAYFCNFCVSWLRSYIMRLNVSSVSPHNLHLVFFRALIILFTHCNIFILELAGSLSLKSEWRQVFSGIPWFSQYSNRTQQCCSLDSFDSVTDFQFLESLHLTLRNRSQYNNYK